MSLTDRETTVLILRQQGLTQAAVARKLKVSQAAVSAFEINAYRKLQDAKAMLAAATEHHLTITKGRR
jgi:transcriptional regulator